MNILSENGSWFINDSEVYLTVLVEDGHIVFFYSKKKGVSTGLLEGLAGFAGILLAPASVVIGGSMWLASLTADALKKKSNLVTALNDIKVKYKLADDEIFISHPDKCSVTLSGKTSFLGVFGDNECTITINGVFIAGDKQIEGKIDQTFHDSTPKEIAKIFSKGNCSVSYAKEP